MKVISAICLIILIALLVAELPLHSRANFSLAIPYIMEDSPRNNVVYNTSQPLVNITIEETFYTGKGRDAYYILDGQDKVSIPLVYKGTGKDNAGFEYSIVSGTTVLPKLSNGTHQIQFFAEYYGADIGKSKMITFSVAASDDSSLSPCFAVVLVAVSLVLAIITLGILYRRHLSKKQSF
jgi:hypothetical protein